MTLRLNPTVAVRLDPVYEYGPEQTNPETGETYREVIGVKPGVHIDMHPRTIETHPALAWAFVDPDHPVHDPGSNVRTWAPTEAAYIAAAPITGGAFDLQAPEPDDEV
jgi:hypothetical protein